MIKKLLIGLLGLLLLLVAAVLLLPGAVDWRPRIAAAVQEATGRSLRIEGPLRLTLLPAPSFSAAGIHFANVAGAAAPDMLSVENIAARLELWPLLGGRLVVDSLSVSRASVDLEIGKDGGPNWVFTKPGHPDEPAGSRKDGDAGLGGLVLRAVRLDQGQLRFHDAGTGQTVEATDIALAGGIDARGVLAWTAHMVLNKAKVAAEFSLDSPARLAAGQSAALKLRLTSPYATASLDGSTRQRPDAALDGTFDLDVPSVGRLAAWLQQPLAAGRADPGPLALHMVTASSGGAIVLKEATLAGKAIQASAQARIDTTVQPAKFEARVDVHKADLDTYLAPEPAPRGAAGGGTAGGAAPAEGWSTEPINLTPLHGANGHLALGIAALRYHGLDIQSATLDATITDGVLRIAKAHAALAGGTIDATGSVAATATPRYDLHAVTAGVQARPLLRVLAGSDRLGGAVALDTTLAGSGGNMAELVGTLAGKGEVKITNGAIYGINLAQSLRKLGTLGLGDSSSEETDFAELGGSYTIKNGVLDNPDLKMLAPLVRLGGKGTVNLPPRTLDYGVEAKLVATLQGQGGRDALAGVPIPIRLRGPWRTVNVAVDWQGVLGGLAADPSKLKDLPADLGGAVKGLGLPQNMPSLPGGLTLPKNPFGK